MWNRHGWHHHEIVYIFYWVWRVKSESDFDFYRHDFQISLSMYIFSSDLTPEALKTYTRFWNRSFSVYFSSNLAAEPRVNSSPPQSRKFQSKKVKISCWRTHLTMLLYTSSRKWRNGRRARFRSVWGYTLEGSNPFFRIRESILKNRFFFCSVKTT